MNKKILKFMFFTFFTFNNSIVKADMETTHENQRKQEEASIAKHKYIQELPSFLKEMDEVEFCQIYGNHIRLENEKYDSDLEVIKIMNKEVKRRKYTLNSLLIKKQLIKLGVSECQLYATLGSSDNINSSVGSWGIHNQYVYKNNIYVYTENGKVTSWQQ